LNQVRKYQILQNSAPRFSNSRASRGKCLSDRNMNYVEQFIRNFKKLLLYQVAGRKQSEVYSRTRCTAERGVQQNEVYNRTRCTAERGVQQSEVYNRTRCTAE
jgi:hypothetical protein